MAISARIRHVPGSARGAIVALALAVLAGCAGGSGANGTPLPIDTASAAPPSFSGPTLEITAANLQFSPVEYEVAAGQAFDIVLVNQDELKHAVYVVEGKRPIGMQTEEQYLNGPYPFKGDYAQAGTTITYHVNALPAGTYQFFCPPHLDMVAKLVVQ